MADQITPHTHYLDFELEIGPGSGLDYAVSVIRSPAGEARETMRFPFGKQALDNLLKDLQIALLRSGGARRQFPSPEEETVQTFGRALFNALISGETRSRYDLSSREARQQGRGLRLKLRIQPPELAALPWEFLYDPRQAEYVCLSRDTPVVRYLELPYPIQPLVISPPLNILGLIASPRDQAPLDIGREKQRMERAVLALQAEGLVNLTWLEGQTWRDLQRAMRGGPWHIFHFIGHGGFDPNTDEGLIALTDEEGFMHCFRATELGRLLADHHSLRLVILNSCEGARGSERDIFSSTASILVRRGIPAVLAMQYPITDLAAVEFARAFYEALADGLPVDASVTEARKSVSLAVSNSVEWGIPVLYMRAPQGIIFQLPETGRARLRTPGPPTFLDKEQEQRLDQLYTEGLSAFWVEDWDRACRCFQTILDEYPGYPNAAAKLEEARRQRRLYTLYQEAITFRQAGKWGPALAALERLVSEAPDFKDGADLLEATGRQKQLADLYEQVRRLSQAEQWQAVVNVFAEIHALDPDYGDPDGLLAQAEQEVAALQRRAELEQLYRRAVNELDARRWAEARRLLVSLQEQEPGFRETGQLLQRAEAELARQEAARQREEQLARLYEQALGLSRAGQWRVALVKMDEIQALDAQFPDPEGVAARARQEIARQEAEAQRQSELAALYAEAVQLLQAQQYQAALEKWGEVQARDPRYPDRQKVQATARQKLKALAQAGAPRRRPPASWLAGHRLPGWAKPALGLLGLAALVAIGALLWPGGALTRPEAETGQLVPTSTSLPAVVPTQAKASPLAAAPTRTPRPTPIPTATMDADRSVYDNFNNPADDGRLNLDRWEYQTHYPDGQAYQDSQALVLTQQGQPGESGQSLVARQIEPFELTVPYFFEAKLSMESSPGNYSSVAFHAGIVPYAILQCGIGATRPPAAYCAVLDLNYPGEFISIVEYPVSLDGWHTLRLEVMPTSKECTLYVDGSQVASQRLPEPTNPAKSLSGLTVRDFVVGLWLPPDTPGGATGYVDDVRIGPIHGWYGEDFETGQAAGWDLGPGWQVQRDGDNYVLAGSGHEWATLTGQTWDDYRVRLRLKLQQGGIHLNYRLAEVPGGMTRYFIGFGENYIYLGKEGTLPLVDLSASHALDRWYQVEIVGVGGHLQVYVDGQLELDYTDTDPLARGGIAFETLPDSRAMLDDIQVTPADQ